MTTPAKPSRTLQLAALYNLVWGAVVVLLPERSFQWAGFEEPALYPQLWQCIGMIVGVYGIGYGIAALRFTTPFAIGPLCWWDCWEKCLGRSVFCKRHGRAICRGRCFAAFLSMT